MFKIILGIFCFIYAFSILQPEKSDITGWIALVAGILFFGLGLAQPRKVNSYGNHSAGGADNYNNIESSGYSSGDGGGGGE